jgi:non-specific serine/threonine protein kinase/serine/threonine-protein kinase
LDDSMGEAADVHARVRSIFEEALARSPEDRETYLVTACHDDDVRHRVRRLLAAHGEAESFLEQPAAPPVEAPDFAGRRLGPYELVREIGRGGMGTVYLARRVDGQFEKDVAIKLVPRGLAGDQAVERFRREQQILASLDHPHIAHLLDAGATDEGVPYVVIEYVQGDPIDRYCDARRLPVADRLRLIATVCDAVQFAHRHLVVHRDLKPSNILVSADGTIKLLDFGIAKLIDDPVSDAALTRTGVHPMTPEYASPEQVAGQRMTTASDVYSLGLLLYELLTGVRAHNLKSSSLDEIVRVVCESAPERPSAALARLAPEEQARIGEARSAPPDRLRRQLEGDLDHIVLAALRKEPDRRYTSVAALADDLRNYLDERPVNARGESVTYRAGKFLRRHALPAAAVALALVALVAGLVATLWQAREAEQARRVADGERRRAERRFADLRALATGFVFEFHDAIATLAGATPARQLVVSKGIQYLDGLAADAARDRSLQTDLADAYDRLSEIQANPYGSNVGDTAGSLESVKKAMAIRETLAEGTPPDSVERRKLVGSLIRLGDTYQSLGRMPDALTAYKRVVAEGEAAIAAGAADADTRARVGAASNRLCGLLQATGDAAGSLVNCERSLSINTALLAARDTPASREAVAGAQMAYANGLRLNGRTEEALAAITKATETLRTLLKEAPDNGRLRLQLATGLGQQGTVQAALGRAADSVSATGEAVALLDSLYTADPGNQRIRTILSYLLLRQSPTLVAAGRTADAAASTRRGLGMLRALAARDGASPTEMNDYASWLLTCEPASERRPAEALQYARKAAASQPHPVYLDTLALALFENGQRSEAVKTAEQALAMLPPVAPGATPGGLRREIEGHLQRFRQPVSPQ